MHSIETINSKKHKESKLTALFFGESRHVIPQHKSRFVWCRCECGNMKEVIVGVLIYGRIKSCGCLLTETLKKNNTKYFPSIKELYAVYKGIKQRCYNPKNPSFEYYGGSGVTMCDEWYNNYQSFLDWCLSNGWQKGLHLDKDKKVKNSKVYSPETVSFLTPYENNQYRRKKGTALA